MSTNTNRSFTPLTLEFGLYAVILTIALAARLYRLGAQPLTEAEAGQALAAWRLASPGSAGSGLARHLPAGRPSLSPLLLSLTTMAFAVGGASETTARLIPALAGASLAVTPALFRHCLGRPGALVVAVFVALSPTVVAASRSADGTTLAALLLIVFVGAVLQWRELGKSPWLTLAATALGAGLATGERWWAGALIAALGFVAVRVVIPDRSRLPKAAQAERPTRLKGLALVAGLTFLLSTTFFGLYRAGLSSAGDGLLSWLAGFQPVETARSVWLIPGAVAIYEPCLLLFGLAGLVSGFVRRAAGTRGCPAGVVSPIPRHRREPGIAGPAGWRSRGAMPRGWKATEQWRLIVVAGSLFAVLYGLIYSGRQASDSVWVTLMLAPLAAAFLVDLLSGEWTGDETGMVAVLAAIILVLLTFSGLSLAGYVESVRADPGAPQTLRLSLAGTALALTVILGALVGLGWSARAAVRGLALGAGLALAFSSVAAGWGLTQLRVADPRELWNAVPTSADIPVLVSTLEAVSDRAVGAVHDLEITVQASPNSALAWALRNFSEARYVDQLGGDIVSPAVIAPESSPGAPTLGSAYVGQAFALHTGWAPQSLTPVDWLGWWVYRRAPLTRERVILWVRQDIQLLEAK